MSNFVSLTDELRHYGVDLGSEEVVSLYPNHDGEIMDEDSDGRVRLTLDNGSRKRFYVSYLLAEAKAIREANDNKPKYYYENFEVERMPFDWKMVVIIVLGCGAIVAAGILGWDLLGA